MVRSPVIELPGGAAIFHGLEVLRKIEGQILRKTCWVARSRRPGQVLRFSDEITRENEKCVKLSLGHFLRCTTIYPAHLSSESPVT